MCPSTFLYFMSKEGMSKEPLIIKVFQIIVNEILSTTVLSVKMREDRFF